MKKMAIYEITKEQMQDTRYRDNRFDHVRIVTEDDWNLYDIWANQCGWFDDYDACEKIAETSDGLIIWQFTKHEDMYDDSSDVIDTLYIAEDTDAAEEATEEDIREMEHY